MSPGACMKLHNTKPSKHRSHTVQMGYRSRKDRTNRGYKPQEGLVIDVPEAEVLHTFHDLSPVELGTTKTLLKGYMWLPEADAGTARQKIRECEASKALKVMPQLHAYI